MLLRDEKRESELLQVLIHEVQMARWSHYLSQNQTGRSRTGRCYLRYKLGATSRQQLRARIWAIEAWRAERACMTLMDTRETALSGFDIVLTDTGPCLIPKDYIKLISRDYGVPREYIGPSLGSHIVSYHWDVRAGAIWSDTPTPYAIPGNS